MNPITLAGYDHDAWYKTFEQLMEVQAAISDLVQEDNHAATPENIRTFFLALFVEVGECLNRLNWKPWKKPTTLDREAILDEAADMTAFWLQTCVILSDAVGATPQDILDAYLRKSAVNVARFTGKVEGYGNIYG